MTGFSFILPLYSMVAGLGMSILVRHIGQMIEARDRMRRYWVHTCWLAFLFVVQVATFLSLWDLKDHSSWTVLLALLLLLIPILLFAASYLAAPNLADVGDLDMRLYYFKQSQWMQGLLLLALLSGSTAVRVIEGRWNMTLRDDLRIAVMLVLLPGIVSRRPTIHVAQTLSLILLLIIALQGVDTPIG